MTSFIVADAPADAVKTCVWQDALPGCVRDLDHNGRLDPYEDARLSPEVRADDLIGRMTLEEKAQAMMHGTAPGIGVPLGDSKIGYDLSAAQALILTRGVTSMITRLAMPPEDMARQNNALQQIAARGRLGIPIVISTDPRNHFHYTPGASVPANGFSSWPDCLGLGALGNAATVRRMGDAARREYRAVGIHMTLGPQADLFSEPRWPRGTGTFGEDPAEVSRLAAAYVIGFQGGPHGLTRDGVMAVAKHWVGYGASRGGLDGHSFYGRYAVFPSGHFDEHVAAFKGVLDADVSAVMPTYDILTGLDIDDKPAEPVGAAFNRPLLQKLRNQFSYHGLILSDWLVTEDCDQSCTTGSPPESAKAIAMPWGVETLSKEERFAKATNAGVDQFGGAEDAQYLLAAIHNGRIPIARIDEAVRRIMIPRFTMGLFDDPYVDPAKVESVFTDRNVAEAALAAQSRSMVVLKRSTLLPLRRGTRVYAPSVAAAALVRDGLLPVARKENADVAILRFGAPYRMMHPGYFFGNFQHDGDLDFKPGDPKTRQILDVAAHVPTILVIDMDRPAILTNLVDHVAALMASFGASDQAVVDVIAGKEPALGHLPVELPSSMEAVRHQAEDAPHDSKSPLFPVHFSAR